MQSDLGVLAHDFLKLLLVQGQKPGVLLYPDGSGSAIIAMMVIDGDWNEQLYVNPSQTDRGLGSALVEHAKALGTNRLELWTFVSNVRAQRFYERHGFVEIDRTNGDNEERQPDIRYRWSAS